MGRREANEHAGGEHDDMVFTVALACWGAQKVGGSGLFGDADWWKRDDP